jgi:hypothetical protein
MLRDVQSDDHRSNHANLPGTILPSWGGRILTGIIAFVVALFFESVPINDIINIVVKIPKTLFDCTVVGSCIGGSLWGLNRIFSTKTITPSNIQRSAETAFSEERRLSKNYFNTWRRSPHSTARQKVPDLPRYWRSLSFD